VSETRKLAAILVSDIVGYSRLAGADEDRILARLRTLRSDLIDPTIAVHHGRIVKRTGDGSIIEFRSVVDAVNCAIEVQRAMVERNAEVAPDKRIEFRIGIHLGDVVEESDGDLIGDGVNIAARLQGIAEPGGICISDDAYRQVKSRLDLKAIDLGPVPLKNIAEPLRAYSLEVGAPPAARSPPQADQAKSAPKRRSSFAPLATAIAAFILLAAAGGWYMLGGRSERPASAGHVSIVVLPFANLSGDPSQDYLPDGITDNLTTDLSRIRNAVVIARNTAFTYKGKSVDAKKIGEELDVRYVLEGSVQREQNRVRVSAQLIDAETGNHLWADRFEEDMADLFNLQDEVVGRLANALDFQLLKAEAEKSAQSKNLDAIDLDMRAVAYLWKPQTKDSMAEARALFEQALKLDPNFADAMAGLAWTYAFDYVYGWPSPDVDYDAKIIGWADRSVALVPDNAYGYAAKTFYLNSSNRPREALAVADVGLAHNPNAAFLFSLRSDAEFALDRFEQAKSDALQALRLEPRGPLTGGAQLALGRAEWGLGRLDAAIDEYRRGIVAGNHDFPTYGSAAALYASADKMEEAKSALAEARRLNPNFTVKWATARGWKPFVLDGLRKAGLPEE
jgi:TolB-like protein/class 3 adenylate cyclase